MEPDEMSLDIIPAKSGRFHVPDLHIEITGQSQEADITIVANDDDEQAVTWYFCPYTEQETGARPDQALGVIQFPWLDTPKSLYGDLDDMADWFNALAHRIEMARQDYHTGHRGLGPV
jgi:hypothetical protein